VAQVPIASGAAQFASPAPEVTLVGAFAQPFDNAVATARTCYAPRIISPADVAKDPERRDRIARSTYEAGHHTTLQHAHFQFSLARVSRQFLWSFLHAHPFYNSEQVSQRYVEVRAGTFAVPPLEGEARTLFEDTLAMQMAAYQRLIEHLTPAAAREYYRIFPARKKNDGGAKDIKKKAQEIARYVLPVATYAHLYHTISALTLLRYYRICQQYDCPLETRLVVTRMVEEMLRHDPAFQTILEEPLALEDTPEFRHYAAAGESIDGALTPQAAARARTFAAEFDAELGGKVSVLVGSKPENQALVAQAVREVVGAPRATMTDEAAIRLALDPAANPLHGQAMTLTTLSKLSRALGHAHYTFKKRLSHTADSQDQRHRMTPGSRPILLAHLTGEPDYTVPELIKRSAAAETVYIDTMARAWDAIARLTVLGVPAEYVAYLLPNAVHVRFTESADLLHLHHKLKARLCYNAQEEIWRASLDEVRQIRDVDPLIARYLLPPCGLRLMTTTRPICPEGDKFCGVPVWKLRIDDYSRVI